jgi:hypothetical protein
MTIPFVTAPWQQPLIVSSVLVVAPTEEPITLDEGKLRAGLNWPAGDPRDALMDDFIAAARSQVEQDTGLALLTQTRHVTYADSIDPLAYVPLPWQAWPVQQITAPTGEVITFKANASTRAIQFAMPSAGTWVVVAGWPTAADLKAEAPLLVQAVGLLTAHFATMGRDLASEARHMEMVPMGYEECIAPYRLIWVT